MVVECFYARRRPPAGWDVQLHFAGGTSATAAPVARYPGDDGPCAEGVVTPVRRSVCQDGAPVDRPGETTACLAAAGFVLDSQRADADGAIGLQPFVPVVRGLEPGRHHLGADRVHEKQIGR